MLTKCPRCGKEPVLMVEKDYRTGVGKTIYYFMCPDYAIGHWSHDAAGAAENWNRIPTDAEEYEKRLDARIAENTRRIEAAKRKEEMKK